MYSDIAKFACEALGISDSEMRRPIAALYALHDRHALNAEIELFSDDDAAFIRVSSEGGEFSARRCQTELRIPLPQLYAALSDPDTLIALSKRLPYAEVCTSDGKGGGMHVYHVHPELVARAIRGALIRLGEYYAVKELGDPSIQLGHYDEPVAAPGPRRTDEDYYTLASEVLFPFDPETGNSTMTLRPYGEAKPMTAKPEPEPRAAANSESEPELAEWELALLASGPCEA